MHIPTKDLAVKRSIWFATAVLVTGTVWLGTNPKGTPNGSTVRSDAGK